MKGKGKGESVSSADVGIAPLTLVVNASSLKYSGARHVAFNVIREFGLREDMSAVHALVPAGRGYEALAGGKVRLHFIESWLQFSAADPARQSRLRNLCRLIKPDAMVNLANLPTRGVLNQFVLIHLPHITHMDHHVAARLSLSDQIKISSKLAVFRRNAKWASGYWVQTEAAQADLKRIYGLESSIMQNAVDTKIVDTHVSRSVTDGRFRLLTLSHYFPHKNLEIIAELAHSVHKRGLPFTFVVTLDPKTDRRTADFLEKVQWAVELGIVDNRGVVPTADIPALFANSDALFLPTLLESFSTTYAEAMRFGIPIVTSDRGFARSVCGPAALYVDPLSADAIEAEITRLAASPALARELVVAGRKRLSSFPNWPEVADAMIRDIRSKTSATRPHR